MAIQCKTWFSVLPKRPTRRIKHKATKVCEKLFEKRSLVINSHGGWLICVFNPVYSVVALSAAGGHVLWRKVMPAPVIYIQSGLQYPSQPSPVVLLISRSMITAINGTTGEKATRARCSHSESYPHQLVWKHFLLLPREDFMASPAEGHRVTGSLTSRPRGRYGPRSSCSHTACR